MDDKIAIIGIFVKELSAAAEVNDLLHEYASCIIGRMGIPFHEKSVNIMSIIVCAPPDTISALSGKLGRIQGITAKSMQSKQ
ncbi:MAG: iron-only hydrogenase system regulator [Lachnospiraceae bacterium]